MYTNNDYSVVATERCIDDFRRGYPVKIGDCIIYSSEQISQSHFDIIKKDSVLVVNSNRAKYIFQQDMDCYIETKELAYGKMLEIAGVCDAVEINTVNIKVNQLAESYSYLNKFAELTHLLPSYIMYSPSDQDHFVTRNNILVVSKHNLENYSVVPSVNRVLQTRLKLLYTSNASIVSYRCNVGRSEHYAILIGDYNKTKMVRVHSSC